jgi:hypothetical protein
MVALLKQCPGATAIRGEPEKPKEDQQEPPTEQLRRF